MVKRNTRISGALLIVVLSLVLASLACYSGQVPGVFELTPYYTPTPLGPALDAQFSVLEVVLAPQEPGRTFFNLTSDPEPLQDSLVNSKTMCQGDSAAKVLYTGQDQHGDVYDLIDCAGSVGWTLETRLAGPLKFTTGDLAITTISEAGTQAVPMLDDLFRPQPFNPLASCKPETIVSVQEVKAADNTNDGNKEVYYRIECPQGNKGWVTNTELVGPVKIQVGDRALAISAEDQGDQVYPLANEPAPVTEANTVTGDCAVGNILEAQEAKLVTDTVYYKMTCGDTEGWTDQSRFIGPLLYNVDDQTLIYMPSIPVFEEDLPSDVSGEVAATGDEDTTATGEGETPTGEVETVPGEEQRNVVEYTPPLYLTDKPGPAVLEGDGTNVVGQCTSGTAAYIEEYAAVDMVYYRIRCDECVSTEVNADGESICSAVETRDGWVEQQYLQGPVKFVPGQMVMFKSSSAAVETTDDGITYARVPASLAGAASIGRYTDFSGRCLLDQGAQVTNILLEKARTSDTFTFYYQIECAGQTATLEQVTEDGITRPQITYNVDETDAVVTGFVSERDLQAIEQ